ncbi:hypothetical protein Aperf_G00000088346 [Anoplocephala perfoliata]
MSSLLFRCSSISIPTYTATSSGLPRSSASPPLPSSSHFPLMSTPSRSVVYVRGRGSFTERRAPHVVLPITPTPPPLPPPPPNPQLTPLKPRSRSQQWSSSKAFGITGLEKLPVRSHSVKAPAQKRVIHGQPPPRPLNKPRLTEDHKSHQQTSASSSTSRSRFTAGSKTASLPSQPPRHISNARQDVFRITISFFHSSLLIVSYIAWTSLLILLLPAFCLSYCIRQIGLLLAQHRRSSLVETLSSLSLHYLHGEDAGRNIVVVIYLGAPGIKIATLKKLLVRRIFSAPPPNSTDRRNCGSKRMERWFAERLQQTVVPIPTGFAWQRCTSVNIDEHVVPAYLVGQSRPGYGRRLSPKKRPPDEEGMVESDKDPVEMLVGQLAAVDLPLNRPLWQVHLVEDYHDTKDALTVRKMEFPFSSPSWQERDILAPWRNSRPNISTTDVMSVTSADRLGTFRRASPAPSVCNSLSVAASNSAGRLASTPTGSLIVFRVHSAITDDAQSLVEYLTILLSEGAFEETKSIASSPVTVQEPGTSKTIESDGLEKKRFSSSGFKVRISESSFEWQDHPEKIPFSVDNQPTSLVTYTSCFCAWLREFNAVRREVMRALFLGPFLMLHNLMMVPADLGLLPSVVPPTPNELETATSIIQRQVFRRIQLPLDKLLHVQKVTRANLSEISMSLLTGALRAYQQTSGLNEPPDLLIRTCAPTPNFELCCERLTQPSRRRDAPEVDIEAQESGHHEAVTALSDIVNGPPAHCIYTPMRLPLSEEGMIPRLWRVHQRVIMLHRTALAVTLEWTRDLLHLLLPHWLALRADSLLLGGASKCSVTFAEVSLENTGNADGISTPTLGKRLKSGNRKRPKFSHPPRRGMVNQNSLKMDISQALRLVNPPNSLNTSSSTSIYEGSESHERNLDLIYLSGGVPIVRIEAWLANRRDAASIESSPFANSPNSQLAKHDDEKASMCRDLAVVTCAYGSHLTVGLTANYRMDGSPGVDLILNTMLKQLNNLYKLIDSRFPAKPVIYAPRRHFHLAAYPGSSSVRMRIIQDSPKIQNRPPVSSNLSISQLSSANIREPQSPDKMIGGELIEDNTNQFLKYNFPPLSSSLRKSSLRRTQKRHSNDLKAIDDPGLQQPSNEGEPTESAKLVPILKAPEISEKSKTKRTSDCRKTKVTKKYSGSRRFGIAKKIKKRPVKPPSPAPRRSQVRFVTEVD